MGIIVKKEGSSLLLGIRCKKKLSYKKILDGMVYKDNLHFFAVRLSVGWHMLNGNVFSAGKLFNPIC
jgi:hypothetical protein